MRCRDCPQAILYDPKDGVNMVLWCRGVQVGEEWLTPPHYTRYRGTCKHPPEVTVPKSRKINWKGARI